MRRNLGREVVGLMLETRHFLALWFGGPQGKVTGWLRSRAEDLGSCAGAVHFAWHWECICAHLVCFEQGFHAADACGSFGNER